MTDKTPPDHEGYMRIAVWTLPATQPRQYTANQEL